LQRTSQLRRGKSGRRIGRWPNASTDWWVICLPTRSKTWVTNFTL
jgi:hypothetical protein